MKWIDNIAEHANKSVKEKRKHEPRPRVQEVIVSVRNSSENDPGECAVGYFIVQGNSVTLTDENGKPLDEKDGTAKIGNADPRSVASIMVRRRWEGSRGEADFNRPLIRKKGGWV
jgi:hypothetical protein